MSMYVSIDDIPNNRIVMYTYNAEIEYKNRSISSCDTISRFTLLHSSVHKLLLMVIISLKANLKNFN